MTGYSFPSPWLSDDRRLAYVLVLLPLADADADAAVW